MCVAIQPASHGSQHPRADTTSGRYTEIACNANTFDDQRGPAAKLLFPCTDTGDRRTAELGPEHQFAARVSMV